jgi:cobalt transporter subunit CbtB
MNSQVLSASRAFPRRLTGALAIFFLGTALVFVAGFAQPDALHEAAHDTRHAMSFPCH